MISLFIGGPMAGKTCKAVEMALSQSKPVYTNIIDNTNDQRFLPKSFKRIPCDDWTLITESSFIIYDSCEYIKEFTARSKQFDHRLDSLFSHRHFGSKQLNHDIIFIFQNEKFAHLHIRQVAEIIKIDHPLFTREFGHL